MKITNVRCQVMGVPALDGSPRRNWVFVSVETDVGITGVGEATTEWHELAVVAMIEKHLGPLIVGTDPTRTEHVWELFQRGIWWRGGIVASSAMSGIDQALWDIKGKAYKLPVYKLLGGPVRNRVRLYARTDLGKATMVEEAVAAVAEGFTAFKAGVGPLIAPFDELAQASVAVEEYHQIREAIGPKVDLMIDCAGFFSQQAAVKLIRHLEPLNLLFIEEPVNADTPRALQQLRRTFPAQRIAAGERLCSRWAFREWMEQGAVDVIQADVSHAGGISELMKIAHFAEVYNVLMAPHNPYGPIALAASAHACAAMANCLILEHCRLPPWFSKVQRFGPTIRHGFVELDDRPGLGVELDGDLIEQFPFRPLQPWTFQDRDGAVPLI